MRKSLYRGFTPFFILQVPILFALTPLNDYIIDFYARNVQGDPGTDKQGNKLKNIVTYIGAFGVNFSIVAALTVV